VTPARSAGVSFAELRRIALRQPEVTEGRYYGRPSFFVGGRFFAGYRADIDVLVATIGFEDRDFLVRAKPSVYFITDHYLNYPTVLVSLATASRAEVEAAVGAAREFALSKPAPKRRGRAGRRSTRPRRSR